MAKHSMMLVTSAWDPSKPFRLMPIDNNCPFVEGIYDLDTQILVMISNIRKQSYHMVAKLDEQGDAQKLKRARAGNQKPYPEERKIMETFQEHYISEKEEIKNVISLFAINAESFPYDQFLEKAIKQPEKPKLILQP